MVIFGRAQLFRAQLEATLTPAQALLALGREDWPFALVGSWADGSAIVGSSPQLLASPDDDPFRVLDRQPHVASSNLPDGVVGGGWFGWLGYLLGRRIEQLPAPPPRPVGLPEFHLAYYDNVVRRDASGRWWFEALITPEREEALLRRLEHIRERFSRSPQRKPWSGPARFVIAGGGRLEHIAAVAECGERIAAGEIFQANLCLRLESAWTGSIVDLFGAATSELSPAYGACFAAPWGGVASLSPELFLRRRGREVETAPIKGTVRRDAELRSATAALKALQSSAKDRAENVMIVDLMRNDLGRVCEYGSIVASPTPAVEPHPGVWHLVSRVRGHLREGTRDSALLNATFPPGSVTGAPKVQAQQVIADLESTAREVYTGAIGFCSPVIGLELNVAIRTFEARNGRLWLGAGGGIVADSDPASEFDECLTKARPLIRAIGSSIADEHTAMSGLSVRAQ